MRRAHDRKRLFTRPAPSVEALEGRCLPALTVSLVRGVLSVVGTEAPENIVVRQSATRIIVAGVARSFLPAQVQSIVVDARGGNDSVNLNSGAAPGERPILVPATLYGGNGNDRLVGGAGPCTFFGGAGADRVYALGGNDVVRGEAGNDYLNAGPGHDFVDGGAGDDVVVGGLGNDRLYGMAGRDTLLGEDGADVLVGDADADLLLGGADNDTLWGDAADVLFAGPGADQVFGGTAQRDVQFLPDRVGFLALGQDNRLVVYPAGITSPGQLTLSGVTAFSVTPTGRVLVALLDGGLLGSDGGGRAGTFATLPPSDVAYTLDSSGTLARYARGYPPRRGAGRCRRPVLRGGALGAGLLPQERQAALGVRRRPARHVFELGL